MSARESATTSSSSPSTGWTFEGFFDEAVALKVLQGGSMGLMSSTVIDFRVGRILGVAFVGSVGDHNRLNLANQLALNLEKRIVQVVLGAI